MERSAFELLEDQASDPRELARTVSYVTENLARFLKKREYVLICFPKRDYPKLGYIFEQAALQLDAIPVFWGPDYKWKTLLRQAFSTRATVIIGQPLVILGLSKLARATGTPLYIRQVLTAGYPCVDWMIDGIIKGLDCGTWGCFGPGVGPVVSGFSCGCSRGVHIRDDLYDVEIVGSDGTCLPDGGHGGIVVTAKGHPETRTRISDCGRLDHSPCSCGQRSVRLVDIVPGANRDPEMLMLLGQLHTWTSILDCHLKKGPYGLEMELVVFQGEKLPKLPTCAKRIIRPWDPDRDTPFNLLEGWKIDRIPEDSH